MVHHNMLGTNRKGIAKGSHLVVEVIVKECKYGGF